jgi:hypothetical protein
MQITRRPEADRHGRRSARRRWTIPARSAIASVALLAAGCGGSSPASQASASAPQSIAASAFKYSRCMRSHGVPNFPDPKVSTQGGQTKLALMVSASAAAGPQFKTAQKACQGIMPGPSDGNPTEQAQQIHARVQLVLAFARCMRNHGVPNFPDPSSQGQLSVEMANAAGVDVHAPAVQAAALSCLPAAGGAITAADIHRAENSGG